MEFSHIGLITENSHQGEVFVEATRVWVTDFTKRPYQVEWLRFEPDSPVTGPVREQSHVAYHVDSLEEASRGLDCVLGPFTPLPGLEVGFYLTDDGAVVELMEYEGNPFGSD